MKSLVQLHIIVKSSTVDRIRNDSRDKKQESSIINLKCKIYFDTLLK